MFVRGDACDRGDEAVAAARDGLYILGVFRGITQGAPELIHAEINPAIHSEVIAIAPQMALNFRGTSSPARSASSTIEHYAKVGALLNRRYFTH